MGDYYSVSRNNIGIIWIVLAIIGLMIVIFPSSTVTVEEIREVSEIQEVTQTIPITTIVESVRNENIRNTVDENVSIPITVSSLGEVSSQLDDEGEEVAEQQFLVRLDEPHKGCLDFTYTFRRKTSIVNIERSILCFDGDTALLEVNEKYSGDVDDYTYSVDFDELIVSRVIDDVEIVSVPVNTTVTEMEEVVSFENVTVVKMVNVSKDVNWILSIFY